MIIFLRFVSILLIFFASLSLAVAGGEVVESEFPNVDIHIRIQEASRLDSPWAIFRPAKWEDGDDEAINPRLDFVIRGDLDPIIRAQLKSWALELNFESFKEKGVWFQNVEHDSRTFLFYPFGARIPGWLARRAGSAIVRESIQISAVGSILPGNLIASFDSDRETYPRDIDSEWSVMQLLVQHSKEAQVTSGSRTIVHKGSTICAGFLEQLLRSQKAH